MQHQTARVVMRNKHLPQADANARLEGRRHFILRGALLALGPSALCLYCLSLGEWDTAFLALAMPVLMGSLMCVSLRQPWFVLNCFMGLLCVAHSFGPAFFFIERDNYSPTGWGAIKSFDFSLQMFFEIYSFLFVYLLLTLGFTICLNRLLYTQPVSSGGNRGAPSFLAQWSELWASRSNAPHNGVGPGVRMTRAPRSESKFPVMLLATLLLGFAALNAYMYSNQVGIAGVQSPELPYRLVGLLTYFARMIVPALIFLLYQRISRGWFPALLVLGYAMWAGFTTLSRATLCLTAVPVIIYSYLDRRYLLMAVGLVSILIGYQWTSLARNTVYSNVATSPADVIQQTVNENDISLFNTISSLLGRIDSPQGIVLAAQTNLMRGGGHPVLAVLEQMLAMPMEGDINRAVLGIDLPRATGFNFGFSGLVIWMAQGSYLWLTFLSLCVALILSFGEFLVRASIRAGASTEAAAAIGFCYVAILFTATDNVQWIYVYVAVAMLGILLIRFSHRRANSQTSGFAR